MNTNTDAKVVLCFGDSNTWGRNPADDLRYNSSQRWTGKLQENLGKDFYIIEEGLCGRTTDMDHARRSYRNGYVYFEPCVESHQPDIVILMLGTNDLKDVFDKSVEQICSSIENYLLHMQSLEKCPKVVLVSPTGIDMKAPNFVKYRDYFSNKAREKGEKLADGYRLLAEKYAASFLDASELVVLGEEGLHWSVESHAKFAEELAEVVKGIE
jgi:lysophospholipase L1-like esterase